MRLAAAGRFTLSICCLAAACRPGSVPAPGQATQATVTAAAPDTESLPGVYSGVLPCADCAGIRHTLALRPDGAFFLRRTYLGEGEHEGDGVDDIGRWTVSGDGALTLAGGREGPLMFAVKEPGMLSKLDLEGRPIRSELSHDLLRAAGGAALEPRLVMRGMYSYMADAGLFTECLTGLRLPVAMEADNAALERAYTAAREEAGHPLLVSVEGRIARRPRMEGPGDQESLVVERFIEVSPGESCDRAGPPVRLESVHWILVVLGDRPVVAIPGRRAPYLRLDPLSKTLSGFAGCNRMTGRYALDGQKLRLGPIALTRMACAEGMELERDYAQALGSVTAWRMLDASLELLDGEGRLLARFEVGASD